LKFEATLPGVFVVATPIGLFLFVALYRIHEPALLARLDGADPERGGKGPGMPRIGQVSTVRRPVDRRTHPWEATGNHLRSAVLVGLQVEGGEVEAGR